MAVRSGVSFDCHRLVVVDLTDRNILACQRAGRWAIYNESINKAVPHRLYPNVPPKIKNNNDEENYTTIDSIYSPKLPIPTAPQLPIRMHRINRDKNNIETSQDNEIDRV